MLLLGLIALQALWVAYATGDAGMQLQKELAEQRQLVGTWLPPVAPCSVLP
jgi:hypothetical protein